MIVARWSGLLLGDEEALKCANFQRIAAALAKRRRRRMHRKVSIFLLLLTEVRLSYVCSRTDSHADPGQASPHFAIIRQQEHLSL